MQILLGDCRETLKKLEDKSVNTCVTSPPYYGLRDYGNDNQIGLEDSINEYVNNLVEVFTEVKRVLKDDGTLWLNLGDSYASRQTNKDRVTDYSSKLFANTGKVCREQKVPAGLKQKDLIGIPWRVAFALQESGWYLRQDIIWEKPNAMPESVKDRCTKAHEYIFLLSKSAQYYYDQEAIKEEATDWGTRNRVNGKYHNEGTGLSPHTGLTKSYEKKNKRSIWSVNTKPYKKAHFATYPPKLIEPCILAGCPEGGTVLDPFAGSGTTAEVSLINNRDVILCELNKDYIDLIDIRLSKVQPNLLGVI